MERYFYIKFSKDIYNENHVAFFISHLSPPKRL
jgi:hypothetical protein